MAKEKAVKASPEKETGEIIFTCKFCGESKPIGEMILQTRFFPVLASCRACDRTLQSLKMEEPATSEDEEASIEESDEKDNETV